MFPLTFPPKMYSIGHILFAKTATIIQKGTDHRVNWKGEELDFENLLLKNACRAQTAQ